MPTSLDSFGDAMHMEHVSAGCSDNWGIDEALDEADIAIVIPSLFQLVLDAIGALLEETRGMGYLVLEPTARMSAI